MKTKINRMILILVGLLCYTSLNAQDTTNFFPHQVGDHWEYRYAEDWSIEQILTIEKDSTDNAGNTFIKYQQKSHYSVRIDSANNIYETPFIGATFLRYKLSGQVGDRWVVNDNSPVYIRMWAQIVDIFPGIVFFNIPATAMQIDYWWETVDDDSFWIETRYLADGYGFVERMFEPGGVTFAAGAIIDGVTYGFLTGLEDRGVVPEEIALAQNYPNPFNPATTIEYQIAIPSSVNLTIFNALGQRVAILVNKYQLPGRYQIAFNAENMNSGVYFYRLHANGKTLTKRMLLLR